MLDFQEISEVILGSQHGNDIAVMAQESSGKLHWYLGDSIWTDDPKELIGHVVLVGDAYPGKELWTKEWKGKVLSYNSTHNYLDIEDQDGNVYSVDVMYIIEITM